MNSEQLKKYVLPYLPYLPVFWFANKLGEAWKMVPDVDVIDQLIGSISLLDAVMARPIYRPFHASPAVRTGTGAF